MKKTKYPIFEDRAYTLSYDDENGKIEYEVTGAQILAQFRRESFLDSLINKITEENTHEDLLDDLREL